jgi:hypothetical protein
MPPFLFPSSWASSPCGYWFLRQQCAQPNLNAFVVVPLLWLDPFDSVQCWLHRERLFSPRDPEADQQRRCVLAFFAQLLLLKRMWGMGGAVGAVCGGGGGGVVQVSVFFVLPPS